MRARVWVATAVAVGLLGCSGLFDEDEEPPPPDPALVNAPTTPPLPTPPANEPPADAPSDAPAGGGFTIPGLEGLPIPLPAPQANAPDPEPPARGSLGAVPGGSVDANGFMTRAFLEQEAETIHQALVGALDAHEASQVREIPFEVVIEHQEPNAAAACTNRSHAAMIITSSMLELAAGIAEAKAYDEVAGTDTYERYVAHVVDLVRREQPIRGVDASWHTAPHATDAHKLARQRHLFDQQIAFIVGHELAHHYRGHTNCVGGRTQAEIDRDELSAVLAHTVPPFSQPREVEADMWGVTNVLEAGRGRAGGEWTVEGALLNLDFFRRLSDHGGQELVMAFLSTHPPSAVRIPIVRSTAQQWTPGWRPPRMPVPGETGGQGGSGIELPTPNGPIRLPDLGNLPIPIPQRQR